MSTPTITLPGLGRIDYTSPGSIAVALGSLLEVINSVAGHDLGLSKYTATAALVIAAAGAVGWLAEAIVKTHPHTPTQAIATGQHLLPEIRQALTEALAAEKAIVADVKTARAKKATP